MKFISWNVNGLRAIVGKGFEEIFRNFDADFFCVQEIKLQEGQINLSYEGYDIYYNYAERKGYSGTAIFARQKPLSVRRGIGRAEHDTEGRVLTLEYTDFFLVNVYTPNSQDQLARLPYRMQWEEAFREYLVGLDSQKPVIICGDLNVAHKEIDLRNPEKNVGCPGFSDEERRCIGKLLDSGFVDSYRLLHPDTTDAYSWWSYRYRAREKNVGWRIDYFLVSQRLAPRVSEASIFPEVMGSDHCPVGLVLD